MANAITSEQTASRQLLDKLNHDAAKRAPNSWSTTVGKLVAVALLLLCGGPALSQTSVKFVGDLQNNRVTIGWITRRSPPSTEATLAGGDACDRPLHLLVEILGVHGPVEARTDLSLGQIEELARQIGSRGKHKPFGFYSSTFNYAIGVDLPETSDGACERIVRVRVDMALTKRRIEIGREMGKDHCLFSTVLEHYRRHAAFDDNTLNRFVQWATTTFNRAPMPPLQGDARSIENVRQRVREFAKKIVKQGQLTFDAERNSAAETVDTPAEIQKLVEGCSTHV